MLFTIKMCDVTVRKNETEQNKSEIVKHAE
uniref:Uncharacterized protein n=1 Tax=Arundo donax TaxID=35708 RepID=A0A0A9GR49_ARUDO